MLYSSERLTAIFDRDIDSREEKIEKLRNKNVLLYRTKTIKSGPILECEIYPVWISKNEANRAKKENKSRLAQLNLNNRNAVKYFIRLINTNFTAEDLAVDLTYKGKAPNEKQAKTDIRNFIRRLKNHCKKNGLPELKYIYVIEFDNIETSKKRIHFHMLLSDMDREVVEKLWNKGYANTRRLQPNEFGLEGLARYMAKDPKGTKRWSASKNLKKPQVTTADYKITRRKAELIARDEDSAPLVFQKLYKGYVFNDINIKYNDYVSGAYIYVRMRKSNVNNKQKIYGVKEW